MKTPEELKKEFEERIDFLSEHWIKGDDKPPFSFGGWRGEVVDELVSITEKAIKGAREELLEEVENCLDGQCDSDGTAPFHWCMDIDVWKTFKSQQEESEEL